MLVGREDWDLVGSALGWGASADGRKPQRLRRHRRGTGI
jgi:hypothetical protein